MTQSDKGQFTADVGTVVALLVVIAIGAVVLYSVSAPLKESVTIPDTTVKNAGSKDVNVKYGVDTATITTTWSGMDNAGDSFEVHLNDENILVVSGSNANNTIENVVTERILRGTNTLEIVKTQADDGTVYSVEGTLDIDTLAQTSAEAVEEKGGTAFNLMTILAIVVVAAVIIGVVVRAIGGFGGRTAPAPTY